VANVIFSKYGDSSHGEDERQFTVELTQTGFLQFYFTGALDGSRFRGVGSTTTAMSTGQFYKIGVSYDGSIDTNNGLDRVQLYVGKIQQSTSLVLNVGSLGDIPSGAARLAVGAAIGTVGPVSYASDIFADAGKLWSRVVTPTEFTVDSWNDGIGVELPLPPDVPPHDHSASQVVQSPDSPPRVIMSDRESSIVHSSDAPSKIIKR
jgi:hypothetical protein